MNFITALNSKFTDKKVMDYLNEFSNTPFLKKSGLEKKSESIQIISRDKDKKITKAKVTITYSENSKVVIDIDIIYDTNDFAISGRGVLNDFGPIIETIQVIDYDGRLIKDTAYVDRVKEKDIFKLYDKDGKLVEEDNSIISIRKSYKYDDDGILLSIKCVSMDDGAKKEIKFKTEFDTSGEYIDSINIIY